MNGVTTSIEPTPPPRSFVTMSSLVVMYSGETVTPASVSGLIASASS